MLTERERRLLDNVVEDIDYTLFDHEWEDAGTDLASRLTNYQRCKKCGQSKYNPPCLEFCMGGFEAARVNDPDMEARIINLHQRLKVIEAQLNLLKQD